MNRWCFISLQISHNLFFRHLFNITAVKQWWMFSPTITKKLSSSAFKNLQVIQVHSVGYMCCTAATLHTLTVHLQMKHLMLTLTFLVYTEPNKADIMLPHCVIPALPYQCYHATGIKSIMFCHIIPALLYTDVDSALWQCSPTFSSVFGHCQTLRIISASLTDKCTQVCTS